MKPPVVSHGTLLKSVPWDKCCTARRTVRKAASRFSRPIGVGSGARTGEDAQRAALRFAAAGGDDGFGAGPWPAMTVPSSRTRMGQTWPNLRKLSRICDDQESETARSLGSGDRRAGG